MDIKTPEYAVVELKVVNLDGVFDGWGIVHEPTETLHEVEGGKPFLARTRSCALGLVAVLNGLTSKPHTCDCHTDN